MPPLPLTSAQVVVLVGRRPTLVSISQAPGAEKRVKSDPRRLQLPLRASGLGLGRQDQGRESYFWPSKRLESGRQQSEVVCEWSGGHCR